MRSLAAHLRQTEAHGQLPFRPDCPICRQLRLHGTVQTGAIGSPRMRAAVAAGLIAVSTVAPPATALAQDGSTPVAADAGGDPANNPDAAPGGDSTDLPDSPAPAPATDPPSDAVPPVDQPPTTDPVV